MKRRLISITLTLLFSIVMLIAFTLTASAASKPTEMWIASSDTNNIPIRIDVFVSDGEYQIYLPGNADVSECFLSWNGGGTVTISGVTGTFASGQCPIPEANTGTTTKYTFKSGNTTLGDYQIITYKGSAKVPAVFIDIDESKGTIEDMDNDPDHNASCSGDIYIDGTKYTLSKIKGRGNATWKESDDKKPYNITIKEKIKFPGIDSKKTKKWSLLAENLDHSLLGNRIGYYLAYELGIGQDSNSADVWMNGEYQGCYTVTAKTDSFVTDDGFMIEQDNYQEAAVADGGDPQFSLTGLNGANGPSTWTSRFNLITVKKMGDNLLGYDENGEVNETPENLTRVATQVIKPWLQNAWDAIRSNSGTSNGKTYDEYVDIESFAKMYLVHEYVKSYDVCAGSIYFHRDGMTDADKLIAGPLWDLDNAMGSTYQNGSLGKADDRTNGDRRSAQGDFIQNITEYKTSIYKTISKRSGFMDEVYRQYDLNRAAFDNLKYDFEQMADDIEDSAMMNHIKVNDLGHGTGKDNHYFSSTTNLGSGDYRQTYYAIRDSKTDWPIYVQNMETYITIRSKWFRDKYNKNLTTVDLVIGKEDGGDYTVKKDGTKVSKPLGNRFNFTVTKNSEIYLKATPDEEYIFKGWYEGVVGSNGAVNPGTTLISADAEYTFTATADKCLCASFEKCTHPEMVEVADDKYLVTPADCTHKAVYYKSCSRCGMAGTETFEHGEPLGHSSYQSVVEERYLKDAADCTHPAVYYKSCGVCLEPVDETFENGDPLGHDWIDKVEEQYLKTAADCTHSAVYYKSCSRCGETNEEETFESGDPLGHDWVDKVEEQYLKTAADCTHKAVYFKSCSRCGEKGTETFESGEPLGHDWINKAEEQYLKTAADCTHKAVYYKSCSRCGLKGTDTFEHGEALGHAWVNKVEAQYLKTAADCTHPAVYYQSCSRCGEKGTATFESGEALGHAWVNKAEEQYLKSAADCTHKAVYYKSCSRCGLKGPETFEYGNALGHDWVNKAEEQYLKTPADCTHKAVYYQSCSRCGEKGTATFESGEALGHDWVNKAEAQYLKSDADCTHKAVYYQSCSRCGQKGTATFESGEPLGHAWENKVEDQYLKSEADCIHPAVYFKSCSRCGVKNEEQTFENGEALGHTWVDKAEAQYLKSAANCSHKAVYYKSCSRCGEQGTETFEDGGFGDHKWNEEFTIDKQATCKEEGSKSIHCSVCGVINESTVTPIQKTDHTYGDWIVTKEATCTENGSKKKTCAVCGDEVTETITANGHTWVECIDKEATCTTDGSKSMHCSVCGVKDESTVTVIPATGHTFGEWVEAPSTCSEHGHKQRSCKVCGFEEKEDLDLLAHDWKTEYTVDKPATCTTDGSKSYHCKNCDATQGSVAIPATGHSYGEWVTTKEATCKATGSKERVCSKCNNKETQTIPKTGHKWNANPTIDKAATCTTDGSKSIHCSICGVKDESTVTVIPKTGHSWNDATYTWSSDNSSVTASRTCRNDSSHKDTETVSTTATVTKPATNTASGETTYTATFSNPAFAQQTKTVADIPALDMPLKIKSLWASQHSVGKVLFKWTKKEGATVTGWNLKYRMRKIGGDNKWSDWTTKSYGAGTMEAWITIPTDYVIEIHAQAKGDSTWSTGIITCPAGGKYQAMKTTHVINVATGKRLTETKVGDSAVYHTAINLKVGQSIKVKPDYEYPVADFQARPRLYPNHLLYDIGDKSMITIIKPDGSTYDGGIIDGVATIKATKAGKTTIIFRSPNGRTMIADVTIS